ncbi:hypothetical protein ANO11243_038990 [Dothideomycetidae sp. 11243]|nr:hypothetical protein ANO11243_038990 [fungal sp. No.11243]
MAVDTRQQLSGLPYEQMRYPTGPHFTNPWVSGAASGQMYSTSSMAQPSIAGDHTRQPTSMAAPTTASMSYPATTLPSLSMSSAHNYKAMPHDHMAMNTHPRRSLRLLLTRSRLPLRPTTPLPTMRRADRRTSHPSVTPNLFLGEPVEALKFRQPTLIDTENRMHAATEAERSSFNDALDASRGMVAMSQDITPRNIYGNQGSSRSSIDSYGFPSTHSAHSSISSASTYGSYYGSSVSEASYGDYSSANESVDVPSRTLPRPSGLVGGALPPAPQSMMGSFSSKVSSSSQKKHKCKICDKRFTRPSSLQTHMYSHTGEKPFACDVEGCGRHFSVVSNLRRHKKVHKGGSDHPSPDDED